MGLAVIVAIVWVRRGSGRISTQKQSRSNPKALELLAEAGYEVVKTKPVVSVQMEIDDRPNPFEIKADYLVARSGRRYVVLLRRDNKSARLQSKLWRNALLRDVLAFEAAGILVLNLEKETLHVVRFRI